MGVPSLFFGNECKHDENRVMRYSLIFCLAQTEPQSIVG